MTRHTLHIGFKQDYVTGERPAWPLSLGTPDVRAVSGDGDFWRAVRGPIPSPDGGAHWEISQECYDAPSTLKDAFEGGALTWAPLNVHVVAP